MSMFRTILVAYDGTSASDVALHMAAELAQAGKARLHVLAILVTSGGLLLNPAAVSSELLDVERKFLVDAMESAVRKLGPHSAAIDTCIRDGEPVREVVAYAHEIKADLVVVGHSDKGVIGRWFEGSVGSQLLDALPCSLLVATGSP